METKLTIEHLEALIDGQTRASGVAPTDMWVAPDAKRQLDEAFRVLGDFPDLPRVSRVTFDTGAITITERYDLPPGAVFLFNREDMPDDVANDQD